VIKNDVVIESQRTDIVDKFIGGTAQKTEKWIKSAEGGVFFLDEAYQLCSPCEKDFGKEALETIMSRMNNNVNPTIHNPVFIFAGYASEMQNFLNLNAGLARRIKTTLLFEDFKPVELTEITKKKLHKVGFKFPHHIEETLID